jgi:hypothetical protein
VAFFAKLTDGQLAGLESVSDPNSGPNLAAIQIPPYDASLASLVDRGAGRTELLSSNPLATRVRRERVQVGQSEPDTEILRPNPDRFDSVHDRRPSDVVPRCGDPGPRRLAPPPIRRVPQNMIDCVDWPRPDAE